MSDSNPETTTAAQTVRDAESGAELGPESKLTSEDLGRVEKYLASPVHQVERKPFRPWMMMGSLVAIVVLLGGFSRLISWFVLG